MKDETMKKIAISLLMLAGTAAFANGAADDQANRAAFDGQYTRAEVNAQYLQAKKSGTLVDTSEAASLRQQAAQGEGRSRADVRAEAVQAARAHVIHELI